jgi:hypothetical protein
MCPFLRSTGREWEGFKPVQYFLDLEVGGLGLKIEENGTQAPVSLGAVWDRLDGKQITQESFDEWAAVWLDLESTDGTKVRLHGPSFNLRLLQAMLQLRQEGVPPFAASWFFYDEDLSLDGDQAAYSCFLVYDGTIVRERLTFYDHHLSGFEPSLFVTGDHSNPTWTNQRASTEAGARYWYRTFYTETVAGKLMMLWPDHRTLFFCEDEQRPDVIGALAVLARSLNSIRLLLWVLIILTVVSFVLRWR